MEKKLLFELNIQNFAGEGDETTSTPTDEVENNENLDENQEDEADPDFEDGQEEVEDEDETQEEDSKEDKGEAKKSSKEQNKINAQRRLQEKHKKELEVEKRKAYLDGLKFAVGERNPYTQEKIEDEFDLENYKIMKEMESKGLDPVEDFPKYVAEKQREEQKKIAEQQKVENERKEKIAIEIDEFDKKHGEGTAYNLLNDEEFKNSKIAKLLGKVSLEDAYDLFIDTKATINSEVEKKAIRQEAISKSSPGRPGKQNVTEHSFMEDILSDDKKFKEFQRQLINKQ